MSAARTFGRSFAIGLIGLAVPTLPALAQDDTRAVRIIEGTPGQPVTPASPSPMGNVDIRQTAIRADNPAGLELAILPDLELTAGAKVTLRVTTKKEGYLILVDVDPSGKLTQIYPNRHTLERRDNPEILNLLKPGQPVTIPNQSNPYAGFEFVASPPAGVAMLVAILSDKPVHILDLPDISPPQAGQAAFDQLLEVARRLRIAREDGNAALEEPTWSFDAKLYVVK
jgi:hypothetical protein